MRRSQDHDGIFSRVAKITGVALLAGASVMLLAQLGTIRRYIRMRRMSNDGHPRPPGTLSPSADAPPRWGTTHWPVH